MERQRNGFTLIELLVVIAIIALLMGILFPVFSRVKEQARSLVCRSNLRQYGIAMRMYVDGNNGRFPGSYVWLYTQAGTGGTPDEAIMDLEPDGTLWPYLKIKDVHMCRTFWIHAKHMRRRNAQYSYSMNAYLGAPRHSAENHSGGVVLEQQVWHPAEIFLFSEENVWLVDGLSEYVLNDNNLLVGPEGDPIDCFATYHNVSSSHLNEGSANLLFVDGHVDSMTAKEQENGGNFRIAWPKRTPPEPD